MLYPQLRFPCLLRSSFVEEGAPDSFADLDAKLKALEEKTKAELAKLQSDTAAPSSFVEEGAPDSFADLDAKLKVRSSRVCVAAEVNATSKCVWCVCRSYHGYRKCKVPGGTEKM